MKPHFRFHRQSKFAFTGEARLLFADAPAAEPEKEKKFRGAVETETKVSVLVKKATDKVESDLNVAKAKIANIRNQVRTWEEGKKSAERPVKYEGEDGLWRLAKDLGYITDKQLEAWEKSKLSPSTKEKPSEGPETEEQLIARARAKFEQLYAEKEALVRQWQQLGQQRRIMHAQWTYEARYAYAMGGPRASMQVGAEYAPVYRQLQGAIARKGADVDAKNREIADLRAEVRANTTWGKTMPESLRRRTSLDLPVDGEVYTTYRRDERDRIWKEKSSWSEEDKRWNQTVEQDGYVQRGPAPRAQAEKGLAPYPTHGISPIGGSVREQSKQHTDFVKKYYDWDNDPAANRPTPNQARAAKDSARKTGLGGNAPSSVPTLPQTPAVPGAAPRRGPSDDGALAAAIKDTPYTVENAAGGFLTTRDDLSNYLGGAVKGNERIALLIGRYRLSKPALFLRIDPKMLTVAEIFIGDHKDLRRHLMPTVPYVAFQKAWQGKRVTDIAFDQDLRDALPGALKGHVA